MNENVKIGSGSLSRNDKKYAFDNGRWHVIEGAHEKAPDYRGKVVLCVNGVEVKLWVSGWIRRGMDGGSFLSLSVDVDGFNKSRLMGLGGQQPLVQAGAPLKVPADNGGLEELPF